jgi:hypothetical protein
VLASYWPLARGATGGARGVLAEPDAVLARFSSRRFSPNAALVAWRRCSPSAVPPLGYRRAPCAAADLRASVELRNDASKQQGNIALKAHVANVCFKCFRCFRGML